MANKNVLNLLECEDGNRIKQGDKSVMQYVLDDTDNDDLDLNGKTAIVYLSDRTGLRYKYDTTVKDNKVDVVINAVLPKGVYTLEIVVDDKYIFPSDNKAKIEITESVVGRALTKVESVDMLDKIVAETLKSEKFTEAVADEANKIATFDKYRTYGKIGFVVSDKSNYSMGENQIILLFNENWKLNTYRRGGYDDYSISRLSKKDINQTFTNILQNALISYPPLVETGGVISEKMDFKPFFKWAYEQQNYSDFPVPFAFRITRKLNGVVVATKDCENNGDLTVEDVDTFTRNEQGATLEVQYRYKDEVITDGMLVEDLTPTE